MPVTVRALGFGRAARPFIDVLWTVYRDDSTWVAPLRRQLRQQLDPRTQPFLQYGQAQLFLAERDGRAVGRISAQINPLHDRQHGERAGFFGFFECLNDPEAAAALLGAAEQWLAARGVDFVRGPLSFTINEEAGTLVDGFDTPPALAMPHGRPYYDALLTGLGYRKVKDLYAWRYPVDDALSERERRWRDGLLARPDIRVRSFSLRHLRRDTRLAAEIFNDAWAANWGFVPVTPAEADRLAKDLRPIADTTMAFFVDVAGQPAAMVICAPNLPAFTRDLNGRLWPLGWAKIWWRLRRGVPSARMLLLGVRPAYRRRDLVGLPLLVVGEIHLRGARRRYRWAELSWILEDNYNLLATMRRIPGGIYKTYRIYQKEAPLPGAALR